MDTLEHADGLAEEVVSLRANLAQRDDRIAAALELHEPLTLTSGEVVCLHCTDEDDGVASVTAYPCPTVRALEGTAR
jgi:hypothetical protein